MNEQEARERATQAILKELGTAPAMYYDSKAAERRATAQRYADAAIKAMGGIDGILAYYGELLVRMSKQIEDLNAEFQDVAAHYGKDEPLVPPEEIRLADVYYPIVSPWERKYNKEQK